MYVAQAAVSVAVTRRTQAERSESTRAALVAAARKLFAEHGYAAVGTEEIVRAAGVTRGALYHHFDGKERLLEAVYEQIEAGLLERIAAQVGVAASGDPLGELTLGAVALIDASRDPEVHRIVLLDAPSVLGWERWREIGWRYGMGLTEAVLGAAIEAGQLPPQPLRPLAHVLLGALDEAALYVARAADPESARRDVALVLQALIDGLRR
jgi:AcrR family transcriptional regulator